MSRNLDPQKHKLYDAEQVLRGRHDVYFKDKAKLQAFVDKITASDWWQERKGPSKVTAIVSRRDSSIADARKSGVYNGKGYGNPVIKLPGSWAPCHSVVLHELAHLITSSSVQSHGPEYARNYIDIVEQFGGCYQARILRESFERRGVKAMEMECE